MIDNQPKFTLGKYVRHRDWEPGRVGIVVQCGPSPNNIIPIYRVQEVGGEKFWYSEHVLLASLPPRALPTPAVPLKFWKGFCVAIVLLLLLLWAAYLGWKAMELARFAPCGKPTFKQTELRA